MEKTIKFISSEWALNFYPTAKRPWSTERRLEEIRKAGFDGVSTRYNSKLLALAHREGMITVGGCDIGKKSEIKPRLSEFRDHGVLHVNLQLCDHDTPVEKSLPIAIAIMEQGRALGLRPMIEFHRDTCTETPEKGYALADAYKKATGELLPMNFDFSHLALVKQLWPHNYAERLLERPDLVRLSTIQHMRPFNGSHCQIPITNGRGGLLPELKTWLIFCEAVLTLWHRAKNWDTYRVIVPEQGPVESGYALSSFPDIWKDTVVLNKEIKKAWKRVQRAEAAKSPATTRK